MSGGVLTTGVVIRRRATTEWMARGGLVFVFFLEVAPVSEGDSFTPSGEDGTRGSGFLFWGLFHMLFRSQALALKNRL